MMRLRRHLALALMLLAASPAFAQSAPGNWSGSLQVTPAVRLNLVVHIRASESGALQGTMDSPDQGAFGIALANIAGAEGRLGFDVPSVGGRFEGRWETNKWTGRWTQGTNSWPLELAAAAAPPPPPPLPANWTIPDDAAIGRLLDERIAGRAGEGIVVAVIEPGGRRLVARGPAGAAAPFDGRTLFEIGSMTKTFTALLLADMVRRGEVALTDPAARYLPEGARMPERNGRRITLGDLATHRSGLPRLPDNFAPADPDNPYADYSEAQLLEFLARYQLTRDIDSQWEYSNLGMGLLGYLLSRRAGMSYEALVRERITGPLALADTIVTLSAEQQARIATGHDAFMRPAPLWDLPTLAGAGAIRSSANDLATYLALALGEGPPELVADMRATTAERRAGARPPVQTGLAWVILTGPGGEAVMHDGGTGGFRTAMGYDPARRRGVIVLTNATVEPSASDLALHLLIGAPLAPAQPVPAAPNAGRTAITVPAEQLDRLTGRYVLTPQLTIEISREGERLMAQVTGAPKLRLHAESPLEFFWREVDARIRFVAEADGRVTSVVFRQSGIELTGRRAP
jgi:D-alanyl-D-alanine-carboxypeptidase/D-alanyl-D-alanine-endopeptidase